MNARKRKNMMSSYTGFAGPETVHHILSTIPAKLMQELAGRQIGEVMDVRNGAYHEGRALLGGLDVLDDCVWIPDADGSTSGKLIPLSVLRKINIENRVKDDDYNRAHGTAYTEDHYTLDATD